MIALRISRSEVDRCPVGGALGASNPSAVSPPRRAASTLPLPFSRRWRALLTGVALLTVTVIDARAEPNQPSTAARDDGAGLDAYVAEAARRFALPTSWIWTVLHIESAGRPKAVSAKGARGLMQIMPATWDELRSRLALGSDPFDLHDNIIAGAAYLRELRDRYGAPGFLAAYNAGPRRYEDHLATGRPLPLETIGYVTAAMRLLNGGAYSDGRSIATPVRPWTEAALFPASGHAHDTLQVGAGNAPVPAPIRRAPGLSPTFAPHSDGLFTSVDVQEARP